MRALFIALFSLFSAGLVKSEPVQWPVDAGGNGHFYELRLDGAYGENNLKSWLRDLNSSMRRTHNGMNGHLATLTNSIEMNWVYNNVVVPSLPSHSITFLGGWNDGFIVNPDQCGSNVVCAELGDWHWITGETWEYAFWAPGEPSDTGPVDGATIEFALTFLYGYFGRTGFNNMQFSTYTGDLVAHLVEYDEYSVLDLPPLDHAIPNTQTTWGQIKAQYR